MNQNADVESLDGVDWNSADTGGSPQTRQRVRRQRKGRWEPLSQRREALRQPERQESLGGSGL
jgi:hypothetical protein